MTAAAAAIFSISCTDGKGDIAKELMHKYMTSVGRNTNMLVQEDISCGERVLGYKVQYMHDGEWTDLCSGSCIGHKRIETFPPCTTDRLRLTVTEAKAKPCIRSFRVFRTI